MKWSRYSHLFESKRNGWLLYNSASNSFMQLDDSAVPQIRQISENPDGYDFSKDPQMYIILRSNGFLVEDKQDNQYYNILKMRRIAGNYDTRSLLITMAVTRACNFDCSYCYEGNKCGSPMSDETADKVIDFIKAHRSAEKLYITWYGGEPLLAFDEILKFDEKVKKLDMPYRAGMITNGYLFNEKIIGRLNDLNIDFLQITLDGNRQTHDARRPLKNGGKTFDVILKNADKVLNSDYKGTVRIRVNVDTRNEDEFFDVYKLIRDKYPEKYGKNITVYPGFVHGDTTHPDISCFYDSKAKAAFVKKMQTEHGISAKALYPEHMYNGCTLTRKNAYVVGPDGELYKCWDDVGDEKNVVGHVDTRTNWNMGLIADGMVGCSYLDSYECKECFYFPVCDGGCHKVRLKNYYDGQDRSVCSYFKDDLEDLLELHYEKKMKKDV